MLNTKKIVSLLLTFAMLITMIPGGFARRSDEDTKIYIVIMADNATTQAVADEINEDFLEENEILAENNMLLAELTEEEAEEVAELDGVLYVEEDFELEANNAMR